MCYAYRTIIRRKLEYELVFWQNNIYPSTSVYVSFIILTYIRGWIVQFQYGIRVDLRSMMICLFIVESISFRPTRVGLLRSEGYNSNKKNEFPFFMIKRSPFFNNKPHNIKLVEKIKNQVCFICIKIMWCGSYNLLVQLIELK